MLGPSKWGKHRCLLHVARHLQYAYRCKVIYFWWRCINTKTNWHNSSDMKDDLFKYAHHNRGPLRLLNMWDYKDNRVIKSNTLIFFFRMLSTITITHVFYGWVRFLIQEIIMQHKSRRMKSPVFPSRCCVTHVWMLSRLPQSIMTTFFFVVVEAKIAQQTNSIPPWGQVGSLPCRTDVSQQVSAVLHFSATSEGVSDGRVTQEVLLTEALRLFLAF